jgi:hypothetical protein
MTTVGICWTEGTVDGMTEGVAVGMEGREGASSTLFEDPSSVFLHFKLMGAAATSPDCASCFNLFLFSFIVSTPANQTQTKTQKRKKGEKEIIFKHWHNNLRFLLAFTKALTEELGTGPSEKVARRSGSVKILYRRSSMSKILRILSCQTEFSNGRSKAAKHKKSTSHTDDKK